MDVRAAETAAMLERSLERMPEESILWLARGETLRSAGRPIEAYEALRRGQRTGAASRQAGEAALRLAQSPAGEESDPATRIVWWRRAAEAADLLLQLDVDVPTLRESADAWLAAGEPSTAAARLRSAMELSGESADLLYQLARCDLAADDVAAAEKHLEAALAAAPDAELEPRIQRALATVYHRRGAYAAAATAYRRAGMVDEAAAVAELAETGRECRELRDRLQGLLESSEARAGSRERRAIEAELEATLATCAHVLQPPVA
jgi:tetratricopeptide (TPR) repeat protein